MVCVLYRICGIINLLKPLLTSSAISSCDITALEVHVFDKSVAVSVGVFEFSLLTTKQNKNNWKLTSRIISFEILTSNTYTKEIEHSIDHIEKIAVYTYTAPVPLSAVKDQLIWNGNFRFVFSPTLIKRKIWNFEWINVTI